MDYFAKKQWIRIAVCAVLVGVIVLAMTGVFSGSKDLIYDPAATNGEAAASTEATEQGFAGDVTAHVTLDGDKIKTLTIDTPSETEGLGKRASETAFTDQFIGKSGPFTYGEDGIEALSGATVTSNAALKAINRAIGAEAPAEEKAEEPAAEATEAPEEKPARRFRGIFLSRVPGGWPEKCPENGYIASRRLRISPSQPNRISS